ncbi:MAG: hypothetical protein QM726_26365 [Chitinophagaceae bacterium]
MPLKPLKISLFASLFTFCIGHTAFSQDKPASISIKPTTDFDQRFYYTPNEVQNVWGYRVGVLINDKFKTGIGGYYMNEASDVVIPAPNASSGILASEPYTVHKKLYLGTVYYEPYLMRRNLWETSLVFETGYGRTVQYNESQKSNQVSAKNNALIIPLGAGLSVNLKLPPLFHLQFLRWIGINAMAGYRTSIYQQDKTYNYNGAYWSLSGAVFLDRMVEDVRNWKKERAIARGKRATQLSF